MSWRERNAPWGLQQLAQRLNISVEQLLARPDIVASAVGLMEGGKAGGRHVAESFMDFVERNGGGAEGVKRAIPHYDTMVMASPGQIGNLQYAQNATIARINREDLRPTFEHLNAVKEGRAQRGTPEGYTKNFSAPYAGMPGGGRNYRVVQAPDGSSHTVPYWAVQQVQRGQFVRGANGEYLVPEAGQGPFQAAWSRPAAPPTNVASARPEGRMALAGPIAPPGPATAPAPGPVETQPLPPVEQPYVSEDKNMPGPGEPGFAVAPPTPPTQPPPMQPDKWDSIQQQAIKNQAAMDDQKGDLIRQQAVNNQVKINQDRPWNAPPVNPPPWQGLANIFGGEGGVSPFAGSFFNKMDGSGFKSGGAVKASKDTAKYRGHPNRGDKCRDCTMFTAPHGCTSVRGAISPYGWCSYFEATPTAVALAIKKAAGQVERNPTELQKEWGNYSMGHFNWQGLEITLENPKGSIRRGKTWEVKMPAAYGYLKKTVGKDGDHIDVYVGDDHASDKVFVIDQVDAETGKFDEHKCMLSFKTQAQAVATYNKGFSDGKGPERMGAVSELSVEKFKDWLKGDTKKPLGKIVRRRAEGGRVQDLDALSKGLDPVPAGRRADVFGPLKSEHDKSVYGAGDEVRLALDLLQRRAHGLYPNTVPPVEEDTFRGQPGGRLLDTLEGVDRQATYEPGGRLADYEIAPPVRRVFEIDSSGQPAAEKSANVNPVDASLTAARKYSRGR